MTEDPQQITLIGSAIKAYAKQHREYGANLHYLKALREQLECQLVTDNDPYQLTQDDVDIILCACRVLGKINAKVWTWILNDMLWAKPQKVFSDSRREINVSKHTEEPR